MKTTPQTKDQTIYHHGVDVLKTFQKIINRDWQDLYIPKWYSDNLEYFSKIDFSKDLRRYLKYHDCGKPHCLNIDSEGKRSFPNHAKISSDLYLNLFGNEWISRLMLKDMDLHTIKPSDINSWLQENSDIALILLISALAEINSNSKAFGGFSSESFKIKAKNLERRAKKILTYFGYVV